MLQQKPFRSVASYLTCQSERDVYQQYAVLSDWTANSRTTAIEALGNNVIHLVTLYLTDVSLLTKPMFEKYNKKHNIYGACTYLTGCHKTVEGILFTVSWFTTAMLIVK